MTKIKMPGLKRYVSKGKVYQYHRATGIAIKSVPGTPAFITEYAAAESKRLGKIEPKDGTFGALCTSYRGSEHFESLARRTQKDYRLVLDYLEPLRDMPQVELTRPFVVKLRDKARREKGRSFSNYLIAVLSAMFAWAIEHNEAEENPVSGVKKTKRPKGSKRANRPWAREEWDAVIRAAPQHIRAVLFALGMLGWRGGEAIAATRDQWDQKAGTIHRKAAKSGKMVKTPVPGALARDLKKMLPHNATTLFVSSKKRPWTANGFRASWQKLRDRLLLDGEIAQGLTLHGLRHTYATRMREAGYDSRTIADMLGQETEGMALHYSREADTEVKLRGVVKSLEKHRKVRQKN